MQVTVNLQKFSPQAKFCSGYRRPLTSGRRPATSAQPMVKQGQFWSKILSRPKIFAYENFWPEQIFDAFTKTSKNPRETLTFNQKALPTNAFLKTSLEPLLRPGDFTKIKLLIYSYIEIFRSLDF